MRVGEHILVLALAAVLTWLLFMGLAPRDPALARATRELSVYSELQGHLRADVLAARGGALRSYDPVVANLEKMRGAVARLQSGAEAHVDAALVTALERSLADQERLIEQFKTRNALLQNSLTYLSLFSARSAGAPEDRKVRMAAGAAWGAVMRLTLDTSPPAVEAAHRRLVELERMCTLGGCTPLTTDILAHGNLLSQQLPAVDELVDKITAPSHRVIIGRFAEHLEDRQRLIDQRTLRFRLLLYLASLLLLYLVGRWGMRLRAQTSLLRRQAALEHAVASLSAGLIGANGEAMKAAVSEGLATIGVSLGAVAVAYHSARLGDLWSAGMEGPELGSLACGRTRVPPLDDGSDQCRLVQLDTKELSYDLRRALPRARTHTAFCLRGRSASTSDFLLIVRPSSIDGRIHPSLVPVLQTAHDAISLAIEQAHAELERAELERQVRHARRIQTIGAFTSGIAHNFNNLLGAIIGNAELAQARLRQIGAPTQNADEILLTAARGRALVENLLDYGRRPDRQRRWMPLDPLVDETVRMARAAMPDRQFDVAPGLRGALSLIDPVQMQQVLLNLCRNADHATPSEAVIRILTDAVTLAEPLRHAHGVLAPGQYLRVHVRDTGAGMPPAVLMRAFEPFYTTRPSGTGLGLATAREIVREAGGEIVIESREGEGTQAQVWLPSAPRERRPRPAASSTAALRGAGETIAYLAASESSRLAGEELLAALGYEAVGFSSVARLVRACREEPERFDALVAEHLGRAGAALTDEEDVSCLPPVRLVATHRIAEVGFASRRWRGVSAVIRLPLDAVELATLLHHYLASRRSSLAQKTPGRLAEPIVSAPEGQEHGGQRHPDQGQRPQRPAAQRPSD